MVKPEWGIKRTCQGCSSPFYDLNRNPIVCPKCQVVFDPEVLQKARRGKPGGKDAEVENTVANKIVVDDLVVDDVEAGASDDDPDLIEDASELGEDEDDMVNVIDNLSDDEVN